MNRYFLAFCLLLLPLFALGQSTAVLDGSYVANMISTSTNFVKNPNAQKNTANVTSAGGTTITRVAASTALFSGTEFNLDDTNAWDATWTVRALDAGLKNRLCEVRILGVSSAADVATLEVLQNSVAVFSQSITFDTTNPKVFGGTFPCGDLTYTSSVKLSGTSNPGLIKVAQVYLGAAVSVSSGEIALPWSLYGVLNSGGSTSGFYLTGSVSDPTLGTTQPNNAVYTARRGDTLFLRIQFNQTGTTGASAGSGYYKINLPSPYVIDTTKTKATGANAVTMVGHGAVYDGTNQWQAEVYALSSTVLGVRLVNPSTGGDWGSTNAPLNSSGLQFSFDISLPISGWSATDIVTPESSISGQARYTTNTAQSISNGTATVIDFEDKVYDINSEVTTGAWKFTAKTSGYYQVNARILFDTSSDWEAGELAGLYIFKNGVAQTYADGKVADAAVSQYMPASVSDVIYLDVGQYIEIKAYQNSDNSRTLIADGKYNTVSISKVTGPGSQSFYISSPLVAAPDGTGIKLKSSTYTDLMTGTDSGTFIIGASSGTTDGHTARANTSIPFKIKNNDATGSFAQFANSGGTLGYVGHDTTGFRVYASNGSTAWASTDTSGNWTMLGNVTSTGGNFVPGTSGKGVDFSANTHASGMTSEVLTRYEEGTWTPVVEGSTVSGTATYGASGQVGRYTRVGRLVTIHGYVDLDNLTGATGTMLISGLPFAQINTVSMYAHCAQFDFLSFTTTASNSTPGGFVTPNYSKITIINVPNNGPSTTAQSASAGDFDFSLWFTCTYTAQ